MATYDQLIAGARKADQAGDAPAARRFLELASAERKKLTGGARGVARKVALGVVGAGKALLETAALPLEASAAIARGARISGLPSGYFREKFTELPGQAFGAALAPIQGALPQLGPDRPLTTGEKAVYGAGKGVGTAASFFVPAGAAAGALRAGSVAQRSAAAMAGQPAVQALSAGAGGAVAEATDNPWLGIAAALAVPVAGAAARRIVSPVTNVRTAEEQRLAGVLAHEGIGPLRPGQTTGSRPLQWLESALDSLPFSSSHGARIAAQQQQQFNRAVLSRAGIQGNAATPHAMQAGYTWLQGQFNRIVNQTNVRLDPQFRTDLQNVVRRYGAKLPSQQRVIVQSYIDDLTTRAGQRIVAIRGPVYQDTRSMLTAQSRGAMNADPLTGQALRGIRQALDDAAERSIPASLRGDWVDTRRMYAAYKNIERSLAGAARAQTVAGNISPAQLMAAQARGPRSMTPGQVVRGTGELNDLARAGVAYLRPLPSSGTAERNIAMDIARGGIPLAGGTVAGGMIGGVPGLAAGTTLSYGLPPAIQAFINSPAGRAWLTNQIAAGRQPQLTPGLLGMIGLEQAARPGLLYQ